MNLNVLHRRLMQDVLDGSSPSKAETHIEMILEW
jgi:hypothetical protein